MTKRALLIGINKYLIPGTDLRGCVNDVADLGATLTEFSGFKKSDLTVLIDKAATRKAIVSGIQKLMKASKTGDVALLHYSGHGSNVPDDVSRRDEADGRDEILCPYDLNWDDPLRDDWLRDTLDDVAAGVHLSVIMDCCHSGTNTRAIQPPDAPVKPRYLPSPWGIAREESRRPNPKSVTGELRRSTRAARRAKDIVDADIPEVLITGCRDSQTSADAFIDGRFNGALTFSLIQAIRASKGRLTYRELHQRASAALKKRKFEQVPQLESRRAQFDLPVFSA
ncbi:MAG: caspase family protein [Acidobacteriota bacterium]|nr:caspase family protein [Acidobacteriota bacterium]